MDKRSDPHPMSPKRRKTTPSYVENVSPTSGVKQKVTALLPLKTGVPSHSKCDTPKHPHCSIVMSKVKKFKPFTDYV